MKKLFLSVMLIAGFMSASYAQKANVSKAKSLINSDKPDFKTAEDAIKAALADPTTKNDAETWFVAGSVFDQKSMQEYKNEIVKKPFDKEVLGSSILTAYGYFTKAYDLDQLPNEKGKIKPKFTKEIKDNLQNYFNVRQLIAYGNDLFTAKDYAGATKAWDAYLSIPDLKMFAPGELKKDTTYYLVKYYNAVAASYAGDTLGAISRLEDLRKTDFANADTYEFLAQQYIWKKDTVKYLEVSKAGAEKFPKNPAFVGNLINYYYFTGKNKEALAYLDQAIDKDPAEPQYYRMKGQILGDDKDINGAKAAYEKALELKPDDKDTVFGMGRLYYNKANELWTEAGNMTAQDPATTTARTNKEAEATDLFKKALPYIQKAHQMDPQNQQIKGALGSLYYKFKMNAEYEALQNEQ